MLVGTPKILNHSVVTENYEMAVRVSKFRNVCFTLNASATVDLDEAQLILERCVSNPGSKIRYVVWQREIGEQRTIHLQGYAELEGEHRITATKRILGLGNTVHLERRAGSQAQAIAYCKKLDSRVAGPFERGTRKRLNPNDKSALEMAQIPGCTEREIMEAHPQVYSRKHAAIRNMLATFQPVRNSMPNIYICYGPTGTGKSSWAYAFAKKNNMTIYVAMVPPRGRDKFWWNGYEQQQVVLLDEFYCTVAYSYMLRLLDRFPMKVEVKGSHAQFNSPYIIITTNKDPKDWYGPSGKSPGIEDRSALERRFKEPETKLLEFRGVTQDPITRVPIGWDYREVQWTGFRSFATDNPEDLYQ